MPPGDTGVRGQLNSFRIECSPWKELQEAAVRPTNVVDKIRTLYA